MINSDRKIYFIDELNHLPSPSSIGESGTSPLGDGGCEEGAGVPGDPQAGKSQEEAEGAAGRR